jgi:hypothetical protein
VIPLIGDIWSSVYSRLTNLWLSTRSLNHGDTMRHVWVIEVLSDLRRFAVEQRMYELDRALAAAGHVAALELANQKAEPTPVEGGPKITR